MAKETRAERKARVAAETQNTGEQNTGALDDEGTKETPPAKKSTLAKGEIVAMVPKKFSLRIDGDTIHHFLPGVQNMQRSLAEHWYSKANGVQIHGE